MGTEQGSQCSESPELLFGAPEVEVDAVRAAVRRQGQLSFHIVANPEDDLAVVRACREYFDGSDRRRREEARRAEAGQPPLVPPPPDGRTDWPTERTETGEATYAWVELSRAERAQLRLDEAGPESETAQQARTAREAGEVVELREPQFVLFSRECRDQRLTEDERRRKGVEYFLLLRATETDPTTHAVLAVGGSDIMYARAADVLDNSRAVSFVLTAGGARRFAALTTNNRPSPGGFHRYIAIVLDGEVMSAPRLNEPITGGSGQISGKFTEAEVRALAALLNAGTMPVALKPLPVAERQVEPKRQ